MEAERVLTFIFTVVSDFALVPSLTVTAKNRKHFEVFVGTSAILTVRFRKKKKKKIFSSIVPLLKNVLFLQHTSVPLVRIFLHITRLSKRKKK
jgi:hypothetical protein